MGASMPGKGEEQRQRGEKQFAAVLDAGEGDGADGTQDSAADKVGCG